MKCENCENQHNGQYGSGRFCSSKCSRSFSSNVNREKTNKKVSNTLKAKMPITIITLICEYCNNKFKRTLKHKHQKYCSSECQNKCPKIKEKLSISRICKLKQGITNDRGIKGLFLFNEKQIRCDSKLEYVCLDWFIKNKKVKDINRCTKSIIYYDQENIKRRYLPDFLIKTNEGIFIVECKSNIGKSLNEKWRKYKELSVIKQEVLKNYALKNNYKYFWFTKEIHLKYYKMLKLD